MKMTYSELEIRHAILLEVGKMKLPRKIAHAISRNISKFESELKILTDQKKDVAERYAKKDDKGEFESEKGMYVFETDENRKLFFEEMNELTKTEVEVEVFNFSSEDLDACDNSDRYDILTAVQETAIEWMIDYKE